MDVKLGVAKVFIFLISLFLIFLIVFPMFIDNKDDNLENKDPIKDNPIEDIDKLNGNYLENLVLKTNDEVKSGDGILVNLGKYGIRYQGYNPNNYVYFNCTDYNNQTSDTCELWRILGVVDGKIKLVRDESIGSYAWDNPEDGTYYSNNWETSTLNTYLNGEYLNNMTIKNNQTSEIIENATWYLRGSNTSEVTKTEMYEIERRKGTISLENPEKLENTKMGLMYPSDIGFASIETDTCTTSTTLIDIKNCSESNWLLKDKEGRTDSTYLITHWPSEDEETSVGAFIFNGDAIKGGGIYNEHEVKPSLYLSNNVDISVGEGTITNPFHLKLNEN